MILRDEIENLGLLLDAHPDERDAGWNAALDAVLGLVNRHLDELTRLRKMAIERDRDGASGYWIGYVGGLDAALDLVRK